MNNLNLNTLIIILLIIFYGSLTNAQINTEQFRENISGHGFKGNAGLEFGLNSGNSNYISVSGNMRLDYYEEDYHLFLVSNYEYKEGNDEKILNHGFAHLRCDINLNTKTSWEIFTQIEFNDLIALNERSLLGTGFRFDVLKYFHQEDSTSAFKIFLGIGAMYENEIYNAQPGTITKDLIRSTNYIDIYWRINDIVNFSLVNYYQPYVKDISNYRLLTDASVQFKISSNLTFSVHLLNRYDNKPVTKLKKDDLELRNGITLAF